MAYCEIEFGKLIRGMVKESYHDTLLVFRQHAILISYDRTYYRYKLCCLQLKNEDWNHPLCAYEKEVPVETTNNFNALGEVITKMLSTVYRDISTFPAEEISLRFMTLVENHIIFECEDEQQQFYDSVLNG